MAKLNKNKQYMHNFELLLILSIIHVEPKGLLEKAKNGCKVVKKLKEKICMDLCYSNPGDGKSAQFRDQSQKETMDSPAPTRFALGVDLTRASYSSSRADLTWCKLMQRQASHTWVTQTVLAA